MELFVALCEEELIPGGTDFPLTVLVEMLPSPSSVPQTVVEPSEPVLVVPPPKMPCSIDAITLRFTHCPPEPDIEPSEVDGPVEPGSGVA